MGRGEAGGKRAFTSEVWEAKLASVQVPKEDMNRLVMQFLIVEGYIEAARLFSSESGTPPGVDLDSITDRMEIRQAVQAGQVDEAIDKVNDLNPEILEHQKVLFFHLHQQRLIELIRAGKVEEALDFAAESLAPQGEENGEFLEELERTVALLAFEDSASSPVGDLLHAAQRQKTASELNAAILSSQCQEKEPRLPLLMKMLMWGQAQLDEKAAYPRITDVSTAALSEPKNN